MLAISPLKSAKNDIESEMEKSMLEDQSIAVDFPDFSTGINLLDSIDFDDLFVGISDGDLLPDLEMDSHEIHLAEFSVSGGEDSAASDVNMTSSVMCGTDRILFEEEEEEERVAISDPGSAGSTSPSSKTDVSPSSKVGEKGRSKSTGSTKNTKRKVKVDWTPELHRRFVQAVEQLGVDKAVPSRILELMGIDCLTRHNIASHLQKYRSHRKHLLAREAEAASWSQRRQMYSGGRGGPAKRADHVSPWIAPTMGFPPATVPPMPHFRPLHVWGHPSVDQSMMPMWHKHLTSPSPPPPHGWVPAQPHPPSLDHHPSYWINPHHHHVPTPGMPCFPPHQPPTRFPTPAGPTTPPLGMYKAEHAGHGVPTAAQGQTVLTQPPSDVHPSKESVDAAIGDVLTKPWLPLPLGLKPPSVDSVMVELQRQGIPKIPPTCA